MAVILVTRLWIFPGGGGAGVRVGVTQNSAYWGKNTKKPSSGINPESGSKSDSQPQSIQFLLSSKSPIWQITQQLNVELLMNNTQPSKL